MHTIIVIVFWLLLLAYICKLVNKLIKNIIGDALVQFKTAEHTPYKLDDITENSMSFSTIIKVANQGKQCATIMDCFVRSQLPYEQYDGIQVDAKAELVGAPREDQYFEAVLIQKQESIDIMIKVKLTARHGKTLTEALLQMVDLPLDIIYQHAARYPWKYSKETLVITNTEILALASNK